MMTAIIIDDELDAIRTLEIFLRKYCPEVQVLATAQRIAEAISAIKLHQPDFILLDIRLAEGNGFDLLEAIQPIEIKVIFTTAYEKHAVRAFRYSATDYLLKPIDPDLLVEAVKKVEEILSMDAEKRVPFSENANKNSPKTIALSNMKGYQIVEVADIIWCQAAVNYTKVTVKGQKKPIMVSQPLKHYANLLPSSFSRVHQSFLVNLAEVSQYIRDDGGYIVMKNGRKIPVSRNRKASFLKDLGVK